MPVTINGNGSITGLSVGGLGSGVVNDTTLASNAVTNAKIASGAITSSSLPSGSVLQVVTASTTSQVNWSSGWTDTGLTANITPNFANSNIIITCFGQTRLAGEYDHGIGFRFIRTPTSDPSSLTAIMTTANNYWQYFYDGNDGPTHDVRGSQTLSVADNTHNSTSSLTYKLQFHSYRSDEGNSARFCDNSSRASMQIMEIKV